MEIKSLSRHGRAEACERQQDLFSYVNNPMVAWNVINDSGVPDPIYTAVTTVVVIRFLHPGVNV